MERYERITENNNRELIDNVFVPFVMNAGISALQPPEIMQVTTTLNRATAIVYERLGPTFSLPKDRALLEPAESDSWNHIRRNVLFRIRVAAAGQALAESTVDDTNDIAAAITAELDGR